MKEILDRIDEISLETLGDIAEGKTSLGDQLQIVELFKDIEKMTSFDLPQDYTIDNELVGKLHFLFFIANPEVRQNEQPQNLLLWVNIPKIQNKISDNYDQELRKQQKIKLIETIKTDLEKGMGENRILRGPTSNANNIHNLLNNQEISGVSEKQLDKMIEDIKLLCEQSLGARSNIFAKRAMAKSTYVYEKTLEHIEKYNEIDTPVQRTFSYNHDTSNSSPSSSSSSSPSSSSSSSSSSSPSSSSSSSHYQQDDYSEDDSEDATESATTTEWVTETEDTYDEDDDDANEELEQRKQQVFEETDKTAYPKLKFLSATEQTQLVNSSNDKYSPPDFIPISKSTNAQQAIKEITHNMRRFEAKKHSGPWEYKRFDADNDNEKNIIIINYFPSEDSKQEVKLHKNHMKQKEKYSNAIRKLSILSGVLTMVDNDDYLTNEPKEKEKIKETIIDMARKVSDEANEIKELDSTGKNKGKEKGKEKRKKVTSVEDFTKSLIEKVERHCPEERNVTREIREAERYFIADYNKNLVTVSLTHKKDEIIGQAAVNLNRSRMTPEQKESYIAIHNKDKNIQPQWFKQLTKPQQQWYLERVPTSLEKQEKAWAEFESLFKSSAEQDTPGIPNHRGETAFVVEKGEKSDESKAVIISESNKHASPSPYEMPLKDRELHTRLNVDQAFKVAQESATESFNELWGEKYKPKDFKIPILMNSLLSEDVKGITADSKLIEAQRSAFLQAKENQQEDGFKWLYSNIGTNAFTTIKGKKEDAHELRDINNIAQSFLSSVIDSNLVLQLNTQLAPHPTNDSKKTREAHKKLCDKIIEDIDNNKDLNTEQRLALKTIAISIFKLREIEGYDSGMGRNRSEYKLAVEKMLVEAMGGVTINNCKSGKDRTGASAIYQNAMTLIAYHNEGQIPSLYTKGDLNRKVSSQDLEQAEKLLMEFYTTSGKLHCSNFADELANFNTCGSNGLKLGRAGIVDDGISDQDNLTAISSRKQSMAATNKPTPFVDDETYKAQLISQADKDQRQLDKLTTDENSKPIKIVQAEKKLEKQQERLRNQEKEPSLTKKVTRNFGRKNSPKNKSKKTEVNQGDAVNKFIKQAVKLADRKNIDPELCVFIDLCVTFTSDYSFINKPQVLVSKQAGKLNEVNDIGEDSTRQQSVALILKVLATPKTKKKNFGETKAIEEFVDKYNNNEIPSNIRKDIQEILDVKEGVILSPKHIQNKMGDLKSIKLAEIEPSAQQSLSKGH